MSEKAADRAASAEGRRTRKIDVRFTEAEYAQVLAMETELGLSRADLIRLKLLDGSGRVVINAKAFLRELDKVGAELARAGNNINQLAHHVNTLRLNGGLDQRVFASFETQMITYFRLLRQLDVSIRKILREMSNKGI